MKKLLFLLLSISFVYAQVHSVNGHTNLSLKTKSWIEIKNTHLVRQQHDYSCGSAALATILTHYYDRNITEEKILQAVMKMKGLSKNSSLEEYKKANGLSFMDLSIYAASKGFRPLGLALDMEALQKIKIPLILYVKIRKSEHFTVYKGMDDTYVYLADPSFGNTKVKRSKFEEMFYQREDLKYPGKVLAIFPPKGKQIEKNSDFMSIPPRSGLIKETIRSQILK